MSSIYKNVLSLVLTCRVIGQATSREVSSCNILFHTKKLVTIKGVISARRQTILITGGTGSFGKAFLNECLTNHDGKLIAHTRGMRNKQFHLARHFGLIM